MRPSDKARKIGLQWLPVFRAICHNQRMGKPRESGGGESTDMNYIIACTTRTGSTLLCDLLAQTGRHGQAHEFYEPILFDQLIKPLGGFTAFDEELADPAGYFSKLRRQLASDNGIFGVKVQARQIEWFAPTLASPAGESLRSAAYIRLTREDRLAQAISGVKALQTGGWHSGIATTLKPQFDAAMITAQLAKIADWEAQWDAFFAQHALTPLQLTYEELTANLPAALEAVAGHIGLPLEAGEAQSLTPRIARQSDAVNAEWREAYAALAG